MHRIALAILITLAAVSCGGSPGTASAPTAPTGPAPAEYARGEQLFNQTCAQCHGLRGSGTQQGPPLVHKVYEPSHHADLTFLLAVRRGVTQHHWQFGNMPPQPNVTDEEIKAITGYIRWLQREVGIR
jgi:mono/diheme cytochrome c family protein